VEDPELANERGSEIDRAVGKRAAGESADVKWGPRAEVAAGNDTFASISDPKGLFFYGVEVLF
jgi:hypothetical protein